MTITATTRAIVYRDCCATTTDAHGCLITIYMVIPINCPTTNAMKINQLFTFRLFIDVDFQNHVTDVQGGRPQCEPRHDGSDGCDTTLQHSIRGGESTNYTTCKTVAFTTIACFSFSARANSNGSRRPRVSPRSSSATYRTYSRDITELPTNLRYPKLVIAMSDGPMNPKERGQQSSIDTRLRPTALKHDSLG